MAQGFCPLQHCSIRLFVAPSPWMLSPWIILPSPWMLSPWITFTFTLDAIALDYFAFSPRITFTLDAFTFTLDYALPSPSSPRDPKGETNLKPPRSAKTSLSAIHICICMYLTRNSQTSKKLSNLKPPRSVKTSLSAVHMYT